MANYGKSALTGAGTGAAAGAAFGPWGAVAGGAIGLAAGLFSAYEEAQDEKERRRILEQASQQLNASTEELQSLVNQWYKDNPSMGSQADVNKYTELVGNYDPYEFVYSDEDTNGDGVPDAIKDFDNNYNVDDYYAPNREALIEKTGDAVQARAAGAGIGRGTGAANQIATAVADKNEDLYKDALEAMNQDRQFAYNLWNAKIQQGQNRLNQLKNAKDTQLSLYGGLAEDFQNWNKSKLQQQIDLDQQKMNNQLFNQT
jgi:gas vesicle protein